MSITQTIDDTRCLDTTILRQDKDIRRRMKKKVYQPFQYSLTNNTKCRNIKSHLGCTS